MHSFKKTSYYNPGDLPQEDIDLLLSYKQNVQDHQRITEEIKKFPNEKEIQLKTDFLTKNESNLNTLQEKIKKFGADTIINSFKNTDNVDDFIFSCMPASITDEKAQSLFEGITDDKFAPEKDINSDEEMA
ncbi:MAG: hypothetical protein QNK11_07195, partial [Legionella sp.]|nr:hypothetical protein [Legionella sp.]